MPSVQRVLRVSPGGRYDNGWSQSFGRHHGSSGCSAQTRFGVVHGLGGDCAASARLPDRDISLACLEAWSRNLFACSFCAISKLNMSAQPSILGTGWITI